MDEPRRSQKQLAERLKGNLDYYNRPHPWRSLRWWTSALVLLAGIAAVPAYYYAKAPETFMNPGPISQAHARFANDCAACHPQGAMIRNDSHAAGNIARADYYVYIDKTCSRCHEYFAFHEPNVVPDKTRPASTGAQDENSSCTSCHREHQTAGKMLPTENQNCAACHARSDLMNDSRIKGHSIAAKFFPTPKTGGLTFFYKPRPPEGYNVAFEAFDQGHPAFQIHTQHLKDPDTLQYNHARHERSDIPNTEFGKRLDCAYCHKSDASGMNFQKITFETNCVQCHALAFDPNISASTNGRDPGIVVPHGRPEEVREFLQALPAKYLEFFIKKNNLTTAQATPLASDAVYKLANSYGVAPQEINQLGPILLQKILYSAEHASTGVGALNRKATGRGTDNTFFPGCAFCHQVSPPRPNVTPTITKAVIFDRWLGDGTFNHAKHQAQTCSQCHSSIHTSQLTSDINIPTQQSCTECHNSKPTGVANNCLDCHHYHNDPRARTVQDGKKPPMAPDNKTATYRNLREMLSGVPVAAASAR